VIVKLVTFLMRDMGPNKLEDNSKVAQEKPV
jgi:hypothetical protein